MKATINSISSPWLRLRTAPSLTAPVAGTVPDGTEVEIDSLIYGASGAPQWAKALARWGDIGLRDESNAPAYWYLSAQWLKLEQPPAPQPTNGETLDVPWFSQVGNLYINDCGPACWCMLAGYAGVSTTVEALIRLMGVANKLTATDAAISCWKKLGLNAEKGAHILAPPFLCLVDYPALPERYITYPYQHWIAVVGVERDKAGNIVNVVYHDPLWDTPARGAYKRIGVNQFHTAEHGTANRARCWRKE